jgi:hypothetical protein
MNIRSHFQKIYHTTSIYNSLIHENQSEIDNVISKLFDGRNNIIKHNN